MGPSPASNSKEYISDGLEDYIGSSSTSQRRFLGTGLKPKATQSEMNFEVSKQLYGTCWAHATSACILKATDRVYKRDGGKLSYKKILAHILGEKEVEYLS